MKKIELFLLKVAGVLYVLWLMVIGDDESIDLANRKLPD